MERFSDKQVLTDQDAEGILEKALANPNYFVEGKPLDMIQNGRIMINGKAFRKMLLFGPPKFYVAWAKDRVVYDFCYDREELLEACKAVMRLVGEREPKEIGFNKINGDSLYHSCDGVWKPEMVKENMDYPFGYREP